MNKKFEKHIEAINASLGVVGAGVTKLAEMTASSKEAAGPTKEETQAIADKAEQVISKLAELGHGAPSQIASNAAYLASGHMAALSGVETVIDLLAGGSKTADAPSQLGQPARAASPAKPDRSKAYRPPRC